MASSLRESRAHDRADGSNKLKVAILASEWGSSKGGLSTLNRELAIQLAKFPEVEITFFLPQCSQEDKQAAFKHNIQIVEATRRPGYEELEWLSFPPEHLQIDVIVGHGVKLSRQPQVIKDFKKCMWVQVVHTDLEELGMSKNYKTEVELCEMADLVIGVGPKLSEAFRTHFRESGKDLNVLDLTPGVSEEFMGIKTSLCR